MCLSVRASAAQATNEAIPEHTVKIYKSRKQSPACNNAACAWVGTQVDQQGSMSVPMRVEEIGNAAFRGCKDLKSVIFDDDSELTTIGVLAFEQTGLSSFIVPKRVTEIHAWAFSRCTELTSVTFATGVKLRLIGYAAFPQNRGSVDQASEDRIASAAKLVCNSW